MKEKFNGKSEANKLITEAGTEALREGVKMINEAFEGFAEGMAAAGRAFEEKRKKEGWW